MNLLLSSSKLSDKHEIVLESPVFCEPVSDFWSRTLFYQGEHPQIILCSCKYPIRMHEFLSGLEQSTIKFISFLSGA